MQATKVTGIIMLVLGVVLFGGAAVTGVAIMRNSSETTVAVGPTPTRTPPIPPTATPTPTPTDVPTKTPRPTKTRPAATDTPAPTQTAVVPTPVPIVWTTAEKNALAWMCYGEVSGMGSAEYDACLSTISTVRARYAYPNGFGETDVISTLLKPGQFNVPIETDAPPPAPRFIDYVNNYAAGARGSCNGYLYFNSNPGGPAVCTIYGAAGLFLNFHNSW